MCFGCRGVPRGFASVADPCPRQPFLDSLWTAFWNPMSIDRTLPMPTPEAVERLAELCLTIRAAFDAATYSAFDALYDKSVSIAQDVLIQEWLAEIAAYRRGEVLHDGPQVPVSVAGSPPGESG